MEPGMSAVPTNFESQPLDMNLWSQNHLARVEQALSQWVGDGAPAGLGDAMRYAVLDGGKRLRPLLVLAAYQAVCSGAPASAVVDDAALRAGLDEAAPRAARGRRRARAAGSAGMAGGQAIDLASVGVALTEDQLRQMHRLKTGALLQGSVLMGAACGHAVGAAYQALSGYGAAMGLAFQVVDDILDVVADSATLGKTAGKDAAADKPTYVSLLGLERAQAYAQELLVEAHAALVSSGLPDTRALAGLADMVVRRSH